MPKTTNLNLNIGYDKENKNQTWLIDKDDNYIILDEAIGAVFNGATSNGIQIKESENHLDWDEE